MTGPEHYREAEALLDSVEDRGFGPEPDHIQTAWLSAAQVHATLALAAATAELDAYDSGGGSATGRTERRAKAWGAALDPAAASA